MTPLGNTVGSLTPTQHAVLVGSLLGDGTLRKQEGKRNALLEVNHASSLKSTSIGSGDTFRSMYSPLRSPAQAMAVGLRIGLRLEAFQFSLAITSGSTGPEKSWFRRTLN